MGKNIKNIYENDQQAQQEGMDPCEYRPELEADEELPERVSLPTIEGFFSDEGVCNTLDTFKDEVVRIVAEFFGEDEEWVKECVYEDTDVDMAAEESLRQLLDERGESIEDYRSWDIRMECLPFGSTDIDLNVMYALKTGRLMTFVQLPVTLDDPDEIEEQIIAGYETTENARVLEVESCDERLLTLCYETQCNECYTDVLYDALYQTLDTLYNGEGVREHIVPWLEVVEQ